MSYEPRIIIVQSDLEREKPNIEYSDSEEDIFLTAILRNEPFSINLGPIGGIPTLLYSCRPELTRFNQKVRDRLDDLDIRYGLDY